MKRGYDDATQAGEQQFYDTDGKLVLLTKFGYDHNGALTRVRCFRQRTSRW